MIESDRFVASTLNEPVEESIERALRPKELQEYVGQEKVRSQLEIFIKHSFLLIFSSFLFIKKYV